MKSYQRKFKKYKVVENILNKVQKSFRSVKMDLEEYVKENIISRDYTIGYAELRRGYELVYPILSIPEGFQMKLEKFFCNYPEDFFMGEPEELSIIHEYVLVNKNTNLEIHVSEKAPRRNLKHFNKSVQLEIKNKILVMDYLIKYKVKIDDMEFNFERDYKGKLMDVILTNILKDKYICYSDFVRVSSKRKKEYELSSRYCRNFLLDRNTDWKKNFERCLESCGIKCDARKIVADIEESLGQITDEHIIKAYYLNKQSSLIVKVHKEQHDNECIFYDDEQLALEMPYPIETVKVNFGIIKEEYSEKLKKHIFEDDIEYMDGISIRVNNDLDMNKKMYILDILEKFKS